MGTREESLPEALFTVDGTKIVTAEQWEKKRRPEILDLFREHVYGREAVKRPKNLGFKTVEKEGMMKGLSKRKKVNITFEGPGGVGLLRLLLFIPTQPVKPVPVFLLINNRRLEDEDPERDMRSPFWPAEYIISRGYAAAVFHVEDIDPDYNDGFQNGVHGIFDSPDQPRPSNAWGTISAWAWGASRVMDYFETDPEINSEQVALVGHSRGGKTALWAGAVDQRFAMVVSNNSGNTGAALSRGKKGETIQIINNGFPHWFTENYKNYNDKEYELPVDQHMLLSLIAPRLLYVASASDDYWADPESEFLSLVHAEPVYRLFGLHGLGTRQFPTLDSPVHRDNVGYHVRTGKHDLLEYDWQCFINFADYYLETGVSCKGLRSQ
ncbi:acetylxylan esterase [Virgibacillus profundi]|uniref:Acetylxylan esterase n=1 Tax=Virgibacillus profundi TaxID=2024555 RepID=A0A2A2IHH7_9BACI|nr:acetylxylan esterase [Virgibacillus profundi]PAV31239.1 acetylxylan esterase [Virgibacillus profundi]PXY55424.1 acetylxylan esterase [Virgibacillus profundi]